jgi:ATP-dependent helicase/nuclease subunit A
MDDVSPTSALGRQPPTAGQRRAADPTCSVWVTASAGTGKTRVLADRVLRLLLAGCDPRQLLCLTFTKAAAAEMVGRVQEDLGRLATTPDRQLDDELAALLGRPASAGERERARTLLAEVLDLPAGLPIMTIHGFCQSLLKRFPLEAEVAPHFEVLDPRSAADLLRAAQAEVLASNRADIRAALGRLAVLLGEATLAAGLNALREDRLRLGALLTRHGGEVERVIAAVHDALDLPPGADLGQVRRAAAADPEIDRAGLLDAARALATGNDRDVACAEIIAGWLAADPEERVRTWSEYECVSLTKDRQPRQREVISRCCGGAFPGATAAVAAEQARLVRWVEREKAAGVAERTAALLRIGAAVLEAYDRRKRYGAALDFDDLIACSRRLLERTGMAAWVQYKLDQQIDHLLVDEGQDTSPEQWAIIEALCAEFFTGAGARPLQRTLFVVGDEKQSIMSVQGADVATYRRFREVFETRARDARHPWREEPLGRSFRSAKPILDVVDAVFADPEVRDGVVSGAGWPAHECFRTTTPGLVEVWPLIQVEPAAKADGWQLPDQHEASARGETQLAQAIAAEIFGWLRARTPLPSTRSPIRPGDIMILLPRRGVLQELLIKNLKQLQVPVAGADRLALTDEIAVMDLIALGEALLLPEDDLSLAAVLRSPLFGLSEEALFELAYDRGEATLYERLRAARDRPPFAEAYARLRELQAQVDFLPPFEFYVRLLGEGGGRRRLLARLGPAAAEPIEAFLAQVLAFEQSHPPSMQAFLHWLRADTTELIRDPDRPRDEVRVLTCHGAKGLEAPIVFIADATFVPTSRDRLLWTEPDGLPLWRVGSQLRDRLSGAADRRAVQAQQQEQRRLLYVALTRAQERLIVAGWQRRTPAAPTWYDWIVMGMEKLGAARVPSSRLGGDVLRHGSGATCGPAQLQLSLSQRPDAPPAPSWLREVVATEPAPARPARPSRMTEEEEPAALSPLLAAGGGGRARGRIVHRLLQALPGRPPEQWELLLGRMLADPALVLGPEEQGALADEVRRVLQMPELAMAYGPNSRAEVPLAGVVGGQAVFGQIDCLAVSEAEVLIVDYKTDREPPGAPDQVPVAYLRQMAAYRALLRRIYPGRAVRCALLWTAGPQLMMLDEGLLAGYAPADAQA